MKEELYSKKLEIRHQFAWLPTFIRNRKPVFGFLFGKWVWLKRYTRILYWSETLGRMKTYDSYLGWHEESFLKDRGVLN